MYNTRACSAVHNNISVSNDIIIIIKLDLDYKTYGLYEFLT